MGARVGKQGNEIEVAEAQEENRSESEVKVMKRTFVERLRTKIVSGDPRSASDGLDRTPIAIERSCDTPVKMLLVDPRSPGMMKGDGGVERTPLLVSQKRESRQEGRVPGRGVIPPAFSLPIPSSKDSLPLLDSGDPRSPAPGFIEPRTPITSIPTIKTADNQPASLLHERMKEAATAAMKQTAAAADTAPAAAGEMEELSD